LGVPGEGITVHAVPLANIITWLTERITAGQFVDHKVYAGLWWLAQVES